MSSLPNDNSFVLEVASAGDNAVSLLTIEESHKNGHCSGAAALSCPVGHLDVAGGDRDANLVTEDRTHLRCAIGCSLLLLLWHLEHSVPRFYCLQYFLKNLTLAAKKKKKKKKL